MVAEISPLFIFALAAALFVGGTPALVSAIYFSVSGVLDIWLVFFLSIIATLVWDGVWYALGHQFVSLDRIRSWRLYERNSALYEKVIAHYGRHQYVLLFLSRFMYGTNSVCSVVSGMFRMNLGAFLVINGLSLAGQFWVLYALSRGVHLYTASLDTPYAVAVALALLIAIALTIRYAIRTYFDRL